MKIVRAKIIFRTECQKYFWASQGFTQSETLTKL
jgi:hypothetical protein